MDITFENVSYVYQEDTPFSHQALDNISLHIPAKKYVAIIGHTGSGKSTLIQHLNGLLTPTKGLVRIGDYEITRDKKLEDLKPLRSQVGIVFQYPEHQLFEETIAKDIAFGPLNFGVDEAEIKQRTERVIEQVGLSKEYLSRSPFDLSGGQMRRVAIAGILAMQPKVLVLDEPTAGLDPKGQREIMDMFYKMHQKNHLTTILVTHSMEDALKYADYIIILNQGTVYMEGKPIDIFKQKEVLKQVGLDVPEVIRFLHQFEETFQCQLPFTGQSIKEIAKQIKRIVEGTDTDE